MVYEEWKPYEKPKQPLFVCRPTTKAVGSNIAESKEPTALVVGARNTF
jgi:hypothetical protein